MADTVLQLQQPLKEGAIRSVNFFNGRLLTSKDLTREQQARREADWRAGLAIGDGVAFGLEVERDGTLDQPQAPVVRVKAGLAVNRKGQTLRLTADTSVALARRFDSATTSCIFAQCNPIGSGTYVAGAGVYLLTIAPAETSEGRAPTNGLDPSNVRCNTDTNVEGVQFRLITVGPQLYAGLDPASPQFRNRLAYRCFGIDGSEQLLRDPWLADAASPTLVDSLRDAGLGEWDVPLALVYWRADGLRFVDAWAVRRRLTLRQKTLLGLPDFCQQDQVALNEAMGWQFQAQLADVIAAAGVPAALGVGENFRFLPPVGVLPLDGPPIRGLAIPNFLAGRVHRAPVHIEGARVRHLFGLARDFPAIDLATEEMLWVYLVRQNRQPATAGLTPARPYALFASGHLPFVGDARFDVNRWDFSNYSSLLTR